MNPIEIDLHWRAEDGVRLPVSVWRPGPGRRALSSALLGGGLGPAEWVLNAQVAGGYARMDPARHLAGLAAALGLSGPGVGMLTAAAVDRTMTRTDEGVTASATVGLRVPTWAAAPDGAPDQELAPIRLDGGHRPGTINITVAVPVPLADAAMVNAAITVTEAKTQALLDAGYRCTGTASDALCVVAPENGGDGEPFAGPRSPWGARIARAVHAAVYAGARDYTELLDGRSSP